MIQENRMLLETILRKLPSISKFTNLISDNKSDERFEQVFEGIFEGLDFVTRDKFELNQLLEIVDDKLDKNLTANGIITSNSFICYNFGDSEITISSSLKEGKNNDPLKLEIKPILNNHESTLMVTYGEVPANADRYANGISTKNRGGATFITCNSNGQIVDFDQMHADDKREVLEIPESTQVIMTEEEMDAEIDEMWHEWAEVHHTDY